MLGDSRSDFGQGPGKSRHPRVFGFIAHFAPAGVITMLLAATRISARGLQVHMSSGADAYPLPSGRNGQSFNPGQMLGVPHYLPFRVNISKISTNSLPLYARHFVADITHADQFG